MANELLNNEQLLDHYKDLGLTSKLVYSAAFAEDENIRVKAALLLAYGNAPVCPDLESDKAAFEYFKIIGLTAVLDNVEFGVWTFRYER